MKRRKMVVAGVTSLALGATTACAPDIDFWGNSVPDPSGAVCAVPTVGPPPPYDPASDTRPPDVTPGYSWLTFEVEIQARGENGSRLCVPIHVVAYARSGEADTLTLNRNKMPASAVDWITNTPVQGEYLALQYDPTDERFQARPPSYEVHISATYLRSEDTLNAGVPFVLRCAIKIGGASVAHDPVEMGSADTASCTLNSNSGWRHY